MTLNAQEHETPLTGPQWGLKDLPHALVLMAAAAIGIYVCYLLALPFLSAMTWALTLAILFAPLHRAIEERLGWPNFAATVAVLMAALMVVAPTTFVARLLVGEAAKGASLVQAEIEAGDWRRAIEAHPVAAPIDRWIEQQINLPAIFGNVASWLTNAGASFVRGSVVQLVGVLLTFYLLFYLLRDRGQALEALRRFSPLSRAEMDQIFAQAADTIHATVYGTVVVACVQGALGGLMFWWLNLPTPLLWGLVMGLLAVVPVLGAFVVWLPAAAYLALNGNWTDAIILALWGAGVVGTIDNILYPMLVGNRLKLHTVPAFISLIGGLSLFGAAGLILGPVAVTITTALLDVWRARIAEASE
jgi:predicted PurR-regulated permease PerM